jgi:hypothetical protein
VNKAASVSVYKDGHLFGAWPRKMRLLGQLPSPEATVADLLEIHIPLQLRSQIGLGLCSILHVWTSVNTKFAEFLFYEVG